jgi:hypothetical protein
MRLGDRNLLTRLADAGRGAKAPPANPATAVAAAVSARRRDNIIAGQSISPMTDAGSLRRMYGAHARAARTAAANCRINLNREPKIYHIQIDR